MNLKPFAFPIKSFLLKRYPSQISQQYGPAADRPQGCGCTHTCEKLQSKDREALENAAEEAAKPYREESHE
jgi:hypothetical protein